MEPLIARNPAGRGSGSFQRRSRRGDRIREGATSAVRRAASGELRPFRPAPPHDLEIDFVNSGCAAAAEMVPGTVRSGGAACSYRAPDPATLIQVIRAWTNLAGTTLI